MAAGVRSVNVCSRLSRHLPGRIFSNVRHYSIQPPEWMGGKWKFNKNGKTDFPEHSETFEERMKELARNGAELRSPPVNIGVDYKPGQYNRSEYIRTTIKNHRNQELEQAARLNKLKVPLDEVQSEWRRETGLKQCHTIAQHYGIYQDLFDGAYFVPVTNMNICYTCEDDEFVLPVYRGNKLPPNLAKTEPLVEFESPKDTFWTLILTNPDGHLSSEDSEYIHWMVGNIRDGDIASGEVLFNYLQPIPPKGTGYHRYVFVLFEQTQKIDYAKWQKGASLGLDERTFKTLDFFREHEGSLVPKGLAFFQSQWDDSVRDAYHKILDMAEPAYEYVHRAPYHPPPKKYPHREPFDRYFDRYRDKKDLAEEVLRMKLKMISPFKENPKQEKFPLIHYEKKYKPSWLKLREEIMHRRLEQYKDLP